MGSKLTPETWITLNELSEDILWLLTSFRMLQWCFAVTLQKSFVETSPDFPATCWEEMMNNFTFFSELYL